jgi:SnoaL-like domain
MLKWKALMIVVCSVVLMTLVAAAPQNSTPASTKAMTLTPQDYIDIQQLVSRYAYAIDNCTNDGYDYADLYSEDGWFGTSRDGRVGNKSQGRDKLAAAARGGARDCNDVPWKGISHMLVNHVITPSPEGASGKVYLVAIGLDGEPTKVEAQGHYEDVYVKTPQGWRFKSRLHLLAPGQAAVSRGSRPPQPVGQGR